MNHHFLKTTHVFLATARLGFSNMWHAIQEAKSGEMPLTVLYAIARKNVRACLMLGGNKRDVNGLYLSATEAEAWLGGIDEPLLALAEGDHNSQCLEAPLVTGHQVSPITGRLF